MNNQQVFVFVMTGVVASTLVVLAIIRAIAGRAGNNAKQPRASELEVDFSERLGRMEQAIDSIAVEVERVSEAQRFVTKILAERKPAQPAIAERADSPR